MLEEICKKENCTGCGMCANLCSKQAIKMLEDKYGFVYPSIDNSLCVGCNLCRSKCPANQNISRCCNIKKVYAAWNKNSKIRKNSTSGGVFSAIASNFIKGGGYVVGVVWDDSFLPEHVLTNDENDIVKFQGSKYSQSNTGKIYHTIKEKILEGEKVLFSGTPCQVAALKSFVGREHEKLYTIDLVCHGVPSNQALMKHYSSFGKEIENVHLRYKDPYWDYSFVKIEFKDMTTYQELTINDAYFNLFNIGYLLRSSCHNCQYTSQCRTGDITLADFWGYKATGFKDINFNKGTSCICVNSQKGQNIIDMLGENVSHVEAELELAVQGNKCFTEPFRIEKQKVAQFWDDYVAGVSLVELNEKYCAKTFSIPKYLWLRRLYRKYRWVFKNGK